MESFAVVPEASSNFQYTNGLGLIGSAGNLEVGINDGAFQGVATSGYDYRDSRWHHVVLVVNSSTVKLYVDGEDTGLSDTHDNTLTSNNANWRIGRDNDANMFNGYIDEVKIYPYARSADEIKTDYRKIAGLNGITTTLGRNTNEALTDGLVLYLPMNEDSWTGTAGEVIDYSGNEFNGTTYGGTQPTTASAKFNRGGSFDLTNDQYMGVAHDDKLIPTNISIALWLYYRESDNAESIIVTKNTSSIGYSLFADNSDNTVKIRIGDTTVDSSNTVLSVNEWQHLAMTYDGTTMRWYLNGELTDESTSASGDIPWTNASVYIAGRGLSTTYVDGIYDEVRIYNRALPSNEMKSLYNWAPGPVMYYPMDENSGTTTVYDKSGNGYNATMGGGMTESDWVPGKFGSALDFDGSDDLLTIPVTGTPMSAAEPYTISVWLYPRSAGESNLGTFFNRYASSVASWGFLNSGRQIVAYSSADEAYSNASLPLNEWTHVAIVREDTSGTTTFYINGDESTADSTYTSSTNYDDDPYYIGADSSSANYAWNGLIDELKVYDYARSRSQLIEDMNAGHPVGGSPIGSPLVHWKFDDLKGDTANEGINNQIGNLGGTGTTCPQSGTSDCPTWTPQGKRGSALDFDGTDDWVYAANGNDNDELLYLSDRVTVTAWVKVDSTDNSSIRPIVDKQNVGQLHYGIGIENGVAYMFAGGTATAYGTTDITDGGASWHYIAGTWDKDINGGEVRIYVDGKLEGTDNETSSIGSWSNVVIGADSWNNGNSWNFDGLIDDVKIYSTALTQEEVIIDMNANSSTSFGTLASSERSTIEGGAGNDPVLYLTFDENAGTTAYDTSGNAFDAVFTNGGWTQGYKSTAFRMGFDSIADYATVSDPATEELDFTDSEDWTISTWIKTRESENITTIFDKGYGGFGTGYGLFYVEGGGAAGIDCEYSSSGVANDAASVIGSNVNDGKWHHLLCVMDRNGSEIGTAGIHLYIDGILVDSDTTLTEGDSSNSSDLIIGEDSTLDEFDGAIDEIKIFDYALTPQQIAYEYNRGEPIGHWKFDECQGITAYDSSGNDNHGTIDIGTSGTNTSEGTCSSGTTTEAWNDGTTGRYNASIYLDSTDDCITVADSDIFSFGDGTNEQPMSITLWVNKPNAAGGHLVDKDVVGGSGEYRFETDSNEKLSFRVVDITGAYHLKEVSSAAYLPDTWQFVTATYDGSKSAAGINLFVNGKLLSGTPTSGGTYTAMENTTANLTIGCRLDGASTAYNFFGGAIDDVRIFNYELSQEQILKIMNQNAGARFGQ